MITSLAGTAGLGARSGALPPQMTDLRRCETVLLVNEDRGCVDVTGDALRAQGLAVLLAPSVEEAIAVMRSGFMPDAILIDLTAGGARCRAFVHTLLDDPAWRAVPALCVAEGSGEMLQVSPLDRRRRLPIPSSASELGELLEGLCSDHREAGGHAEL
jgi:CheY-like chemotaxis protein